MKKNKGFTFMELLVVITIIGIIFASGAVAFSAITVRSRDARRRSDLELIRQALEMCRSITGIYPQSIYQDGRISCSVDGPITLSKVPNDPKPSGICPLLYLYTRADDTTYTLTSCSEVSGTAYEVYSP